MHSYTEASYRFYRTCTEKASVERRGKVSSWVEPREGGKDFYEYENMLVEVKLFIIAILNCIETGRKKNLD